MKKLAAIFVVLLVIGLVLVLGFSKFIGKGIAAGVESYGPEITQTSVTLEGVDLSALTGSGTISGLVLGNPEGFSSEYAMKVDSMKLKLKPMSVLSDKVVIEEVLIDGPGLIYESTAMFKSNIGTILKNVEAFTGPEEAAVEEGESALKFQVDLIRLSNVKVSVASQLAGDTQASLALEDLRIENLGQGPEGVTMGDVLKAVFKAINGELVKSLVSSNQGLGDNLKKMGEEAEKNVGGLLRGLKDSLEKKEKKE